MEGCVDVCGLVLSGNDETFRLNKQLSHPLHDACTERASEFN